jgi:hypothetical protein
VLPYHLHLVFLVSLAHNQVNSTPAVPERAVQQYKGKRYEAPYTTYRLFTSTVTSLLFGPVSQYSLLFRCSVRSFATHNTKVWLYSFCRNKGSHYEDEHVFVLQECGALFDGSLPVLNTETNTVNCRKICSPICCETVADLKVCVRLLRKGGVQVCFLSLVNAP